MTSGMCGTHWMGGQKSERGGKCKIGNSSFTLFNCLLNGSHATWLIIGTINQTVSSLSYLTLSLGFTIYVSKRQTRERWDADAGKPSNYSCT